MKSLNFNHRFKLFRFSSRLKEKRQKKMNYLQIFVHWYKLISVRKNDVISPYKRKKGNKMFQKKGLICDSGIFRCKIWNSFAFSNKNRSTNAWSIMNNRIWFRNSVHGQMFTWNSLKYVVHNTMNLMKNLFYKFQVWRICWKSSVRF